MLVHLDQTQSPVIILIGDCLNTGGLSCSCISVKQAVICLLSADKALCIVDQFLFCDLISDQII